MRLPTVLSLALLLGLSVAQGQEASPTATPAATPSPSVSPAPSATATPSPTATPTPSPTPDMEELIEGMSGVQMDKAIAAIKANYFDAKATNEEEAKRALLMGLVFNLQPGVEILTEVKVPEGGQKIPFLSEILDASVGYLRIGAISTESLAQMDTALKKFTDEGAKAVVIDLRGCPASYDYDLAAKYALRFCKQGKLLFTIQKPSAKQERIFTSNKEPVFDGVIIVLTDENNMGGAEAIAASLRASASAMIVGERTSGGAIEFADVNIGEGKILRIANAQVVLPGGGLIYPKGVKPDIEVRINPEVQKEIFRLSAEKGVSQFVFEKERAHVNEAALVANTNPEIESIQEARRSNGKEPIYDTALQRALDLVTTINFYKKQK
ncbi:MAG: S41 family peptidase [Chthoniobacterales bacterium]